MANCGSDNNPFRNFYYRLLSDEHLLEKIENANNFPTVLAYSYCGHPRNEERFSTYDSCLSYYGWKDLSIGDKEGSKLIHWWYRQMGRSEIDSYKERSELKRIRMIHFYCHSKADQHNYQQSFNECCINLKDTCARPPILPFPKGGRAF